MLVSPHWTFSMLTKLIWDLSTPSFLAKFSRMDCVVIEGVVSLEELEGVGTVGLGEDMGVVVNSGVGVGLNGLAKNQ
ncbi:hypothetical protein A3C26_00135 [Candidatus Daviesbacteria bacterium RIFCSPHIGHO2_02_FULL_39_12]|uniref:Uncharacterized protein n=2 Tax=Candidatus Daviesiibacteriota TaxID=1752718 RepID=A0A1F5JBU7_9BACT|nr:MAG: hypothetical protein A3C26_00135 [Candidatus Daviesbacteria bacterium RIFCSPHIGHO2_02_FULL_39_12]